MSQHFTLRCTTCGYTYPKGTFAYLCPVCEQKNNAESPPAGVLRTEYEYDNISAQYNGKHIFEKLSEKSFTDILPIDNPGNFGPLKVGNTPLYHFEIANGQAGKISFYLKDDSQNPTFSFKDRASQLVSAYAKEHQFDTIVAASTGNAGSSLAGICASQKQKAVIIVPETAPAAKLLQIIMYGAILVPVKGNYDSAFDLSVEASKHFSWFNRNTAYNPFTIEGKKTVSFEIYEQFRGKLPEFIFVPAGDGVIISGLYKGFEDLMKLGILKKIPVIVAVQSEKSDNLVRNIEGNTFTMRPSSTIADSISVDYPRNFYMAKGFLQQYNGKWMSVKDEEILSAQAFLSRETGIFAEPAAAAAMAGMLKYNRTQPSDPGTTMLILSTGSGLKDIQTPMKYISMPEPIIPEISALSHFISKQEIR
jgi:threonine synthase